MYRYIAIISAQSTINFEKLELTYISKRLFAFYCTIVEVQYECAITRHNKEHTVTRTQWSEAASTEIHKYYEGVLNEYTEEEWGRLSDNILDYVTKHQKLILKRIKGGDVMKVVQKMVSIEEFSSSSDGEGEDEDAVHDEGLSNDDTLAEDSFHHVEEEEMLCGEGSAMGASTIEASVVEGSIGEPTNTATDSSSQLSKAEDVEIDDRNVQTPHQSPSITTLIEVGISQSPNNIS